MSRDAEAPELSQLRFECTQCGECCTNRGDYAYVYLSDPELNRLAGHLGLLPSEFRQRYTFEDEYGWTQLYLEERCVFLDPGTRRCSVYPARPTQCRTFPFWPGLVKDGRWTPEAHAICEGIGRGPRHPFAEIERNMDEMERSEEE